VTRATVLPQEPSFDRGEVTEKGSLNQRAMRRAHEQIIEALYRGTGEVYLAKF
jgi:feruloyl-CoA synthase